MSAAASASDAFFKFPHTPHLVCLGPGAPRADKVLTPSEVADFLNAPVVVEEKIDGANLGLALGPDGRIRPQSRGNYLAPGHSHAQWDPLWPWLSAHSSQLSAGLSDGLMLFGEWCYARHTLPYDHLPDWFLGFDIYDRTARKFWSTDRRNEWLHRCGLHSTPELFRGRLQRNQLAALVTTSRLRTGVMEGIYLRRETDQWLSSRAKVVSPVFQQQIEEHWTRRALVPNRKVLAANLLAT